MDKRTRGITLSSMFTALTVVMLYISNVSPSGQMGLVAASSLFAAAAVIETGCGAGLFVYLASSIVGALIVPNKGLLLLYVVFFGYYPVLKNLFERANSLALRWIFKLAVFNIAVTGTWFFLREIVFGSNWRQINIIIVYIAGNLVFLLFDVGLSKLILFYETRVSKYMNRK